MPSMKQLHWVLRKHFLKLRIFTSSCLKFLTLSFELALWKEAALKAKNDGEHGFHCCAQLHNTLPLVRSVSAQTPLLALELFRPGFYGAWVLGLGPCGHLSLVTRKGLAWAGGPPALGAHRGVLCPSKVWLQLDPWVTGRSPVGRRQHRGWQELWPAQASCCLRAFATLPSPFLH